MVLAVDDIEEGLLELFGDRSRFAGADRAAVYFPYRCDLGGRAGEESLLGDIELVPRETLLRERDLLLLRELKYGLACDPFQYRGEGRGLRGGLR